MTEVNSGRNGQLMITYRCSAACRHCLVMAAPSQDATLMSVEDAVRYALEYHQLGRRVMIAGGEALLFFEHVLDMCRAIRNEGVPIDFIESNASWCTSDERVTEGLMLLKDAGVEGMYFSLDAYHQEFIRAERVCRGIRIARELFGDHRVLAPRLTNEQAEALERVVHDPARLAEYVDARRLYLLGRAADELTQFCEPIPRDQLEKQSCRRELDIDELHEIQVDPFGFVRPDLCPGVNLGDGRDASLVELVQTRRVRSTPLLSGLAEAGPASLLPLARKRGFCPRPAYAGKCALCFDIRRHLVDHMPAEFGPPHLYRHRQALA